LKTASLAFLALLVALALAFSAACAPHHHAGDDDQSSAADDDDDTMPPDDDDNDDASPQADDDVSPDDDDNDDATDVFAVGSAGVILHYDGSTWSSMASPTTDTLAAVWGSSGSDVFAVGGSADFPSGTSDAVVVHYDGSSWTAMPIVPNAWPGTSMFLNSVWGASSSSVVAVGSAGGVEDVVLQYDGVAWAVAWTGDVSYASGLGGVWGTSPSDVFAVGYYDSEPLFFELVSNVLHWNGESWTSNVSEGWLYGIWGTGDRDVFAVGHYFDFYGQPAGDLIEHYGGLIWSIAYAQPATGAPNLYAIWGSSSTEVYAVGDVILQYDGLSWTLVETGVPGYFAGVWGTSHSDVFIVGATTSGNNGVLLHYDGASWLNVPLGSVPRLWGIWGPTR
jgi:hypothetical protein